MLIRRVTAGLAVTVAAAALSACGGAEPAAEPAAASKADAAKVTIKAFDFQPDPLTVKAGTTISFVNTDQIHHTATAGTRGKATPEVFNAKMEAAAGPGRSTEAQITLDEPGTYDYFCKFHPGDGMVGKIVVN
jgi:plastocyanin